MDRFWSKVDKTGDCWLWMACCTGGYGMFRFDDRMVQAHRVAWFLTHDEFPAGMLDHRVTCPKNCVNPSHLRVATSKQNQENRAGLTSSNTTGFRGVKRQGNGWVARVHHHGKSHYLGYFSAAEEAAEAARLKRIELFTHNDLD